MGDWCLNKFDEDYPRACLSLEKCNRTFPTIIQGSCTFGKQIKFTGLILNYLVLQMQYFKFKISKIP